MPMQQTRLARAERPCRDPSATHLVARSPRTMCSLRCCRSRPWIRDQCQSQGGRPTAPMGVGRLVSAAIAILHSCPHAPQSEILLHLFCHFARSFRPPSVAGGRRRHGVR
eukprot:5714267-Prymnesium_polylepis.1